jgi:hypothetical protein
MLYGLFSHTPRLTFVSVHPDYQKHHKLPHRQLHRFLDGIAFVHLLDQVHQHRRRRDDHAAVPRELGNAQPP